jgi:hypothetical protein
MNSYREQERRTSGCVGYTSYPVGPPGSARRVSMQNEVESMMTRIVMATMAAALLGCGSAIAQVGGIGVSPGPSPLGMTSPLGIGPGSAVPPTGLPLGTTEVPTLGVSPTTSGTSPLPPTTSCGGIGGSIPQASFGAASTGMGTASGTGTSSAGTSSSTFDGGSTAGTPSGTCGGAAGSSLAGPAASASSPTGMGSGSTGSRIGIPMGSTELGVGGLSPPPVVSAPNPSAPQSTLGTTTSPCSTTGMPSSSC